MAQNNKRNYTQSFTYDKIGNMLTKVSTESKYPNVSVSALNYTNAYSYYTDAPHRAEIIGDMYYKYDNNGNVIEERQGGHREETVGGTFSYTYPDTDITRASQAFGWDRGGETEPDSTYRREYTWDEENRLTGTSDPSYTTVYTYDHEGERTVKYSDLGEPLYFDSMWLEADTEGTGRLRCTKNIYIGETRIASKLNYKGEGTDYEDIHTYYYHTDHLSSSNVVTDTDGEVYEHMEYTPKDAWASSKLACDQPYGEKWILDQNDNSKYDMIPYRFTAKEYDEETGLYYMSARYQNPEASRWVSCDPAGWGLVNPNREGFLIIESMNPYSYAGNNPIKYRDPTGMWVDNEDGTFTAEQDDTLYGLAGEDWQNKTGFERDPASLQVGEKVNYSPGNEGSSGDGLDLEGMQDFLDRNPISDEPINHSAGGLNPLEPRSAISDMMQESIENTRQDMIDNKNNGGMTNFQKKILGAGIMALGVGSFFSTVNRIRKGEYSKLNAIGAKKLMGRLGLSWSIFGTGAVITGSADLNNAIPTEVEAINKVRDKLSE